MIHSITSRWPTPEQKCWAMFYWNHIARRQTSPMILHGIALPDTVHSRNNILHVRSRENYSTSGNRRNTNNDFDYDLYNGRTPQGQEARGVRGEPQYASGAGFDLVTKTGRFQLAPTSPGANAGQAIPNFTGAYSGPAPDMGAHQRGVPPMRFGIDVK